MDFNNQDQGRLIIQRLRKNARLVIAIILGAILIFSCFFVVETEEVGVIVRFGKYVRTEQPGLHMKIPFMEKVMKVPVERQQKEEFGFRTTNPGVQTEYQSRVIMMNR